jgi:hypothetical protein
MPTDEERAAAHAAVPWGDAASRLAGWMRASLDNQSVDLIEATLGAPHARAAIVALYEGADVLLQSAIDLADALTARAVLARIDPHDPLGGDDARLNDPGKRRLPSRIARFRVEDAAVKAASAADHLVNAHLSVAWETNAATQPEMIVCGFDPSEETPAFWSSCEQLRKGLKASRPDPLGIFKSFALNAEFRSMAQPLSCRRADTEITSSIGNAQATASFEASGARLDGTVAASTLSSRHRKLRRCRPSRTGSPLSQLLEPRHLTTPTRCGSSREGGCIRSVSRSHKTETRCECEPRPARSGRARPAIRGRSW